MEVCNVKTGQLFEDIKYRQEDNKFKPLHEIQKLVAEQG